MYADSPRSRIAREFFYILNSLRDHYRALFRMEAYETVRINRMLTLLSIYMLREEGMKIFKPQDVIRETGLSQSTVYRIMGEWVDEGLLEDKMGEYQCLSETPDFILNPKELYGRPLAVVKDKDYHTEELIRKSIREAFEKWSGPALERMEQKIRSIPLSVTAPTEIPMEPIKTSGQKDVLDEVDDEDNDDLSDFEM